MRLVLFAQADLALLRARQARGDLLLLWDERLADRFEGSGLVFEPASRHIRPADREAIDEAAFAWTKTWGNRPLMGSRSLREALVWKGVSLWWFAELFLHHSTESPRYVRLIESFHRLMEAVRPESVEALGLLPEEEWLLGRSCAARAIPFAGSRTLAPGLYRGTTLARSLTSRWNTAKTALAVLKSALLGPAPAPAGDRDVVLFLSHAAFWRERDGSDAEAYEHYFGRLIPELERETALQPFVLAVGPRAAHRRRGPRERLGDWLRPPDAGRPYVHINRYTDLRVLREVLVATRQARRAWRALRRSPHLVEAFSHRGVSFAEIAAPDLAGTLLLQLPWAVRSYEEMASALRRVRPAAVCLYAESSGWGRAAVAACRAAGVRTVAVQHGILYLNYFSYRHGADEADCPRPDRTAVFGEAARRLLLGRGGYAPESLVVTGSPRFDDLLVASRQGDRAGLRARLGVGADERLLVVASRFHPIRPTHQAIGSAFPAFVRAVESLPGVRALVKPHPAEPPDAYAAPLRELRSPRTSLVAPSADLLELLQAADALVTVESLSAVEALVLGRPVVILNMPTNLREMVEAGAALGVAEREDPAPVLRAILFDETTRERLQAARDRYLLHVAAGVDGRATERIVTLIRQTARREGMVALAR